ncbi:unnamed protein product [Bursaphelenchus okinawaensis]|uniref:Uncharacterized protein n=1 Tax=Bursaphelenchus okinawaensis TaxID=465554 RepID=A0A811KX57_9BILA|nr:unnamed protein product [Bursaphelenchus okinawaensis]CAG9113150.1 unnamed protein product [Bursaphelenchus okinawaensis]
MDLQPGKSASPSAKKNLNQEKHRINEQKSSYLVTMLSLIQSLETLLIQRENKRKAMHKLSTDLKLHKESINSRIDDLTAKARKLSKMAKENTKVRESASESFASSKFGTCHSNSKVVEQKQSETLDNILKRLEVLEKVKAKETIGASITSPATNHNVEREESSALYGVCEMTGNYELCAKSIDDCISQLKCVRTMPALICRSNVEGINSTEQVDYVIQVLEAFGKRLKNSLQYAHFDGSPRAHRSRENVLS